ncbi:MAG: methylenetetrahydrofolate reductase C-terminal domain-containing protein [Xanthobacteraceae bacterium]
MRALRYWSVRHAAGLEQLYGLFSRIAPALAPAVRWLGASRSEIVLKPVERWAKGLMFDCRMCGQCALASTGMACPTNCAKRMRNGPCGGVRPDGSCEIDRAMRCVWVEALEGRKRIAPPGRAPVLAPIDHSRKGRSTWIRVIEGLTDTPQADAPAARERPIERFEQACRSPRFVVTVEIAPPDSADPSALLARAARFSGLVDAVNITDGAGGNCHMSSAAAAAVLAAHGHTPVCQIACRDRNRIAVQGDILGAAALGVRNFLCLTGDDVGQGDHPQAKPVFDLDAVTLLRIARDMRDRGEFASGRKLDVAPDLFLGATANPFVPPFADRVANLEQKFDSGAGFIQTQFCFDLRLLEQFMQAVRERGLHRRSRIIVGVGALNSARALHWMLRHVPGVHVPQDVIRRVAAAQDQVAEGLDVLVESIRAIRQIEGVGGVHLMGHRNEAVLAEAIVRSGIREGPQSSVA